MISIRDEHLEEEVNTERQRRGDATQAKTLGDLARERLTELRVRRELERFTDDGNPSPDPQSESPASNRPEPAQA